MWSNEYDDDADYDGDCDDDDYLPRFVLENGVKVYLRAGCLHQPLTVRGNSFHLTGGAGSVSCGQGHRTVIRGNVEVYGNKAVFTNITFPGTVRVPGNEADFINCCFDGGGPMYSE
ncbi:MAG: hypothetical protein ACMUIA_05000 [bacterium]